MIAHKFRYMTDVVCVWLLLMSIIYSRLLCLAGLRNESNWFVSVLLRIIYVNPRMSALSGYLTSDIVHGNGRYFSRIAATDDDRTR